MPGGERCPYPGGLDTGSAGSRGRDHPTAVPSSLRKQTPDAIADADRLDPSTIDHTVHYALELPANARATEIVVYPMSEKGHQ